MNPSPLAKQIKIESMVKTILCHQLFKTSCNQANNEKEPEDYESHSRCCLNRRI